MNISLTKMVKIQNSSDSDSGRRPMLKSDEFSFFTILVIEIWMLRFDTFSKNAILFGSATLLNDERTTANTRAYGRHLPYPSSKGEPI